MGRLNCLRLRWGWGRRSADRTLSLEVNIEVPEREPCEAPGACLRVTRGSRAGLGRGQRESALGAAELCALS